MERQHSFASRLSLKTVIPAAILFLAAILVLEWRNSYVIVKQSREYATESITTMETGIHGIFTEIENTAKIVSRVTEQYYNAGHTLDSAQCYKLLKQTIEGVDIILGCGFYYAPYKFSSKSSRTGIYVNLNSEDNSYELEWDDDESTALDKWDYYDEDFYKIPIESGESHWMSPYLEPLADWEYRMMSTYVCPLKSSDGEIFGVFAIDLSLDWIQAMLAQTNPYEKSNLFIVDQDLKVICNPASDKPFEGDFHSTQILKGMDVSKSTTWVNRETMGNPDGEGYVKIKAGHQDAFLVWDVMDNGWILCLAGPYSEVFKDLRTLLAMLPFLILISLALLYYLNRTTIHKLSEPIKDFAAAAGKITGGRFDVPIPDTDTDDELADLGDALRYMQESATKYISELEVTTSEKEKLKNELDVARTIQSQMLNREFPVLESCGISADSIPAKQVGGDLYDFTVRDNFLYFILGDVSGKGVPAALLMAITIAAFRASGKKGYSMEEIVSRINDTFCKSNEDLMFVTLVAGRINLSDGETEFCNAGHNPMLIINPEGKADFVKAKSNVACGVMPGFRFEGERLKLGKGSRLVIYSDGITEAENTVKEQFGEQRLLEWAESAGRSADSDNKAVESLFKTVSGFTAGAEQNDDITVMSISL